jgi:hypothetical protein
VIFFYTRSGSQGIHFCSSFVVSHSSQKVGDWCHVANFCIKKKKKKGAG